MTRPIRKHQCRECDDRTCTTVGPGKPFQCPYHNHFQSRWRFVSYGRETKNWIKYCVGVIIGYALGFIIGIL